MKSCWNCKWSINFSDKIRLCKWAELNEIMLPPYLISGINIKDNVPKPIYVIDYAENCNVYECE